MTPLPQPDLVLGRVYALLLTSIREAQWFRPSTTPGLFEIDLERRTNRCASPDFRGTGGAELGIDAEVEDVRYP